MKITFRRRKFPKLTDQQKKNLFKAVPEDLKRSKAFSSPPVPGVDVRGKGKKPQ